MPMTQSKTITKPEILGNRLQAVLALHRLSMSTFAGRCSVTHSVISRICAGKRQPSRPLLRVMRMELGDGTFSYVTGASDVLPTALQEVGA